MPLTLRTVEPTDVSLNRIPAPIPGRRLDELQCVANGTLANLIRQLGTLSSHGAQLFEDLNKSLEAIDRRLEALDLRSTSLQERIQMGAGIGQESGLHENLRRKPYQTANDIDQHSLSRQTLPAAMMELYNQCDAPPRLREFDQFREDGKSALKSYTDPGYFFELWREQILKECQNDRRMRSARVSSAAANLPSGQKSPARRRRQQDAQRRPGHNSQVLLNNYSSGAYQYEYRSVSGILRPTQNEFVQFPTEYQAPQISRVNRQMEIPSGMSRPSNNQMNPQFSASNLYNDEEPLPPPPLNYRPPNIGMGSQSTIGVYSQAPTSLLMTTNSSTPSEIDLPQALGGLGHGQHANGFSGATSETSSSAHQPILHIDEDDDELPPPPPALNSSAAGNYPASGLQFLAPTANTEQMISSTPTIANQFVDEGALIISSFDSKTETVPASDHASTQEMKPKLNFLEELQAGKELRKVQREEQARAAMNTNTVAELLKRRMALGYQQDESTDDEKGEDGHDSEWDD